MVFIKSFKNQTWLFPPAIEDLIPGDHVCFLVENLIDSLDLSVFEERYEGAGHPAYHPRILLKLLIMGVLDKVRSSRKLAKNARESVVYMYLAEKLTPDFRTISDFRKDKSENLRFLFDNKIDGYIPSQRKKIENRYDKSNFIYDRENDEYVCPEGKSVIFFSESFDILLNKRIRIYRGVDCLNCLKQKECTKRKNGIRTVKMYPYEEERHAMDRKMQLPESKEIYKLRKETVEPVFGDIKENKGVIGFLTKGLRMAKTEMNLISIANNIYRFHFRRNKPGSEGIAF